MVKEEIMNTEAEDALPLGVVLVTHTDYGERLIAASEFILGKQKACMAVSVDGTQDVQETVEKLKEVVKSCDSGSGTIILTDMFGGTPTNLSLSLLNTSNVEVVTGVNLPMLLKVLGARTEDLAKVAGEAKNAGCQGIVVAGEVLRRKVAKGSGK